MYEMMKKQNFGVEIELTGITREQAANVIANYYGTRSRYLGTGYHTFGADDQTGRTWKAMSDSSIRTERLSNGTLVIADSEYACEVVTPILQYDDLEDLQNIVRALQDAGAIANSSCGIHVHVDGKSHTPASLIRLLNFAIGRQDLFYEALEIGARANHWCQKMNAQLFIAMKNDSEKTLDSLKQIWYSTVNDGYRDGINQRHYNPTRYHGINLHAFFTRGTVEFRLFNGTTDVEKIKSYIQFCLAMSAWAIDCQGTRLFFKDCSGYTAEQKKSLMIRVLANRLGLNGAEFKTCRQCLTAAFQKQNKVA